MVEEDMHAIKKPALAVDVILFTIKGDDLKVGLAKRDEDPYFGRYCLPGRFVRYAEPLLETARLALKLKAGINPESVYLEQLGTFGDDLNRDTRIRTVTVVYYALVNAEHIDFKDDALLEWRSAYELPDLAFDHKRLIEYALSRLRKKVMAGNFAYFLLPKEFTLSQVQGSCEVILGTKLDKRNFRKRFKDLGILKELREKKTAGAHRPAQLYVFKEKPEQKLF